MYFLIDPLGWINDERMAEQYSVTNTGSIRLPQVVGNPHTLRIGDRRHSSCLKTATLTSSRALVKGAGRGAHSDHGRGSGFQDKGILIDCSYLSYR